MSARRIFVTGGSGFVGRPLLRALNRSGHQSVTALDRSGMLAADPELAGVRIVRGDLLEPATYERELAGCEVVVHLASSTGKATAATHFRVIAAGTEALLDASRKAGVPKFVFVSSIAAGFPDKRDYAYAQAKERAEAAVAASGLQYTIVRPAMILGDGAPILASLSLLALPPVIVLPGSGNVRVQPVAVDDVVMVIQSLIEQDRFANDTLEVAGPEVLTMEELLQRIREGRKGRRGPVLRIPVGLIQAPLRVAESLGLHAMLPATAGQFSSFRHDGIASGAVSTARTPVAHMLATPAPDHGRNTDIDRECRVFTRHLLGRDADEVVISSYRRAIALVPALAPGDAWDRALLTFAARGRVRAWLADAHAALFARNSTLRKRLVMLLAILESRSPYADAIDRPLGGNAPMAILWLVLRGLLAIGVLVLGSVVLLPIRVLSRRSGAGA